MLNAAAITTCRTGLRGQLIEPRDAGYDAARKVCGVVWCYSGPIKKADQVFKPIRSVKTPLLDFVGPLPHPTLQSMFDGLYPSGHQWYWKADFVRDIPDEAVALHVKHGALQNIKPAK